MNKIVELHVASTAGFEIGQDVSFDGGATHYRVVGLSGQRLWVQELENDESKSSAGCDDAMLERVASLAHEVWSGWIVRMFARCERNYKAPGGDEVGYVRYILHRDDAERWRRQAYTNYEDLTEIERASDREIALRYINLMLDLDV